MKDLSITDLIDIINATKPTIAMNPETNQMEVLFGSDDSEELYTEATKELKSRTK